MIQSREINQSIESFLATKSRRGTLEMIAHVAPDSNQLPFELSKGPQRRKMLVDNLSVHVYDCLDTESRNGAAIWLSTLSSKADSLLVETLLTSRSISVQIGGSI